MPICPKCQSELDEFKGKFVCSNEECDFSLSKAKFTQSKLPWYTRLCQDNTLWQKEVFEEYPSIIAHEYWRLYDLLGKGQPYGAFLQLKDMFEVLIKFPTLIGASILYGKQERSDEENKILIALLEKWLTLGTWEEIARTMGRKLKLHQNIADIQKDIVLLFHEHGIREWRNKAIGHGALAFDADDEFQQDIEEKLRLLKTHFQDYAEAYLTLRLYLRVNKHQVLLQGKEKARNLDHPASEIHIQLAEGIEHVLSPYILLRGRGIYFFDSYIPRDEKTVILNYPEGDKQYIRSNELASLYATLSRDHTLKRFSSSLADETYSAFEAETLEKIAAIDDFQKPIYLKKWLKELADRHSKGLFLLQMERGMGKTTFARALDQQSMSRIHLNEPDNFSIRSYYINSAYLYKIENFTSRVSSLLLTDINRRIVIQGNLPILTRHSGRKREDFAEMLNFYRREHQRHFQKEKLLFILDGMDEIPATDEVSIFDFLPTPELLDEGVYLLLTCRSEPEISHFTKNHLDTMTFTDRLSVQRDDLRHVDLLRAYIINQIAPNKKQQIEILLNKAENRFLYLKTIKELLKTSQHPEYVHLSDGKTLFTEFLDTLRHAYGEKFFVGVVKLLAIFSTAFVPLTLKEISYLFEEEKPTFKLLAHLIDLRGFLKTEHSYRGSLLSIAHPDLCDVILEGYGQTIQELLQRWIVERVLGETGEIEIEDEGKIYLFTHLVDYMNTYAEKSYDAVFDAAFAERLSTLAIKLQRESLAEHHRERVIELYSTVMEIQERLLHTGMLQDEQALAKTLMNRGRAYSYMHRIEDAIADYDRVIEMHQHLLATGTLQDEDRLAAALVNRGTSYMQLQKIEKAITDYSQAIESRQKLFKKGQLQDECSLARVCVNRGNAYRRLHKMQAAIADFDRALEIQQRCFDAGILKHEHELAAAFMNRGIVYMQLHETQKALADYDRAIELQQQLLDAGKLRDENHLAKALINRAILQEWEQQPQKAIPDFTQAIEIQERLLHIGKLIDENELARSFVNRGLAYKAIHKRQEAITDYSWAIAIQEKLLDEGKLLDKYELAWTLSNRGEAYTGEHQLEEAITDFDRAMAVQQDLLHIGALPDEREFALTLMNRGIAYTKKEQIAKAFEDFDRAIAKQQELLQAGKLSDEDELAWALLHRGIAYRENHQIAEALVDFDQAIAIQQRLKKAGKLLDEHDLALALMHKGITLDNVQRKQEAFDLLQKASDMLKTLLPDKPYFMGTYIQTVRHLLSIVEEDGNTEERDRLLTEAEKMGVITRVS
jgi:tetratricopeptide (TPR) repeat protein